MREVGRAKARGAGRRRRRVFAPAAQGFPRCSGAWPCGVTRFAPRGRCAQTGRRKSEIRSALRAPASHPARLGCAHACAAGPPPAPSPRQRLTAEKATRWTVGVDRIPIMRAATKRAVASSTHGSPNRTHSSHAPMSPGAAGGGGAAGMSAAPSGGGSGWARAARFVLQTCGTLSERSSQRERSELCRTSPNHPREGSRPTGPTAAAIPAAPSPPDATRDPRPAVPPRANEDQAFGGARSG